MIRHATEQDLPRILEMGPRITATTNPVAPYSASRVELMAREFITNGIALVSEHRGAVDGLICGIVVPLWSREGSVAAEMVIWVHPEARGRLIGRRLIAAFEKSARELGACCVSLGDVWTEAGYSSGGLFDRLGYTVAERAFVKGV